MHAVELVFGVGWALFWMYWLVAAFSMKRSHGPRSRKLGIRAVIYALVIIVIRLGAHAGILLAGVGSAVALDWAWLIVVALAGVHFLYSAIVEERNMTVLFVDTYPVYKRSTTMLVPFVF